MAIRAKAGTTTFVVTVLVPRLLATCGASAFAVDAFAESVSGTAQAAWCAPASCRAGAVDPSAVGAVAEASAGPGSATAVGLDPTAGLSSAASAQPASAAAACIPPVAVGAPAEAWALPAAAGCAALDPVAVGAAASAACAPADVVAQAMDPTAVSGTAEAACTPASAASAGVDPTAVGAPAAVSCSPAAAVAEGVDPTAVGETVEVSADPASVGAAAVDPVAVGATAEASCLPATVTPEAVDPVAVGAPAEVSADPASAPAAGVDPVAVAAVEASADPASATSTAVDPVGVGAAASASCVPADAAAAGVDPTAVGQAAEASADPASVSGSGVDPTAVGGTAEASCAPASATAEAIDPVVASDVEASADPASVGAAAVDPVAAGAPAEVSCEPATATPEAVDPTAVAASAEASAAPASVAAAALDPVGVGAPAEVSCLPAAATPEAVDPTAVAAAAEATASPASVAAVGVDPTGVGAPAEVTAAPASVASSAVDPTAVASAASASTDPADATAAAVDPVAVGATAEASVSPASAIAQGVDPVGVAAAASASGDPADATAGAVDPTAIGSAASASASPASATAAGVDPVASDGVFPLSVVSNTYFQDDSSNPFLVRGNMGWFLPQCADATETTTWLNYFEGLGVNCVGMMAIVQFQGSGPTNANGDDPFAGTAFQSSLDPDYWDHLLWQVQQARARGMAVILFPAYLGFAGASPTEGWAAEVAAAGETNMEDYGEAVGAYFADEPNVIWGVGGDRRPNESPEGDVLPEIQAMVTGLLSQDSSKLVVGHGKRSYPATTDYTGCSLDIADVYCGHADLASSLLTAAGLSLPMLELECRWPGGTDYTDQRAMNQAWWPVLVEGCGFIQGDAQSTSWDPDDWPTELPQTIWDYSEIAWDFFDSFDWQTLSYDSAHDILTSGYGSSSNETFAPCAQTSDQDRTVVYTPTADASLTIDLSECGGSSVKAYWLNPATGDSAYIGEFATTGSRTFLGPPFAAVLVLDDASASLPAPGTLYTRPPNTVRHWDLTECTEVSGRVSAIEEQVSGSDDYTQGTAGNRPYYVGADSDWGNLPSMDANGAAIGHSLYLSRSGGAISAPCTEILLVCLKSSSTSTYGAIVGNGSYERVVMQDTGDHDAYIASTTFTDTGYDFVVDEPVACIVEWNGSSSQFNAREQDGTTYTSGTLNPGTATASSDDLFGIGGSYGWGGSFRERLIVSGIMPGADWDEYAAKRLQLLHQFQDAT